MTEFEDIEHKLIPGKSILTVNSGQSNGPETGIYLGHNDKILRIQGDVSERTIERRDITDIDLSEFTAP